MLYLHGCPSEISAILIARSITALLLAAGLAAPAAAQAPPKKIDLSQFPAESVENVVVPVPSEVFGVLDRLGNPNWRAELGQAQSHTPSANRAQVALLLGTVIADGFVAVEAEDSERIKEIGRNVLTLAEAINVRKSVVARSNSIIQKADAREWDAVRREFDGALQDVNRAMAELNDEQLAQLVSLGGWIRGTEVLTSIVNQKYSAARAELLHQPMLIGYFTGQIDGMGARLRNNDLVASVRKALAEIDPLIQDAPRGTVSPDAVQKINEITAPLVRRIREG